MDNFTKQIKSKRSFLKGQTLKNLRFKFAFLLLTFTIMLNVKAQINIAPTATATASTCNSGACSTLNDNVFGTCGTQLMWITSAASNPGSAIFIQFTWSSQQRMNKITIHAGESANRFLGGGTIQIWNGSAWVNHSTFTQSTGVCNYDINFPAISTTQLRIVDIVVTGTQSSNVNFREIQIWSAPSGTNDAGVSSIDSPYTYCSAGNYDVKATIRNFGVNQISGVTVNWSVGGTLQTPITYTSLLDTTGGSSASSAQVTLGTYSFPSTAVSIKAWTSLPNSTIDTSRGNDTSTVTKAPSMGGIYTINTTGSRSTNFTTFAAAISALNANGVCGPVIFNVAAATYTVTTPITIGNINGTSAINTITFEGTSAVNRIITGSIASSAVFILNASRYVTLRNLTITNTNTTPAGLCVTGTFRAININNCRITVPIVATTSTTGYALSVTGTASGYGVAAQSGDSITIDSNIITGGGYGLVVYGASSALVNRGILIRNNTINSSNYMGCYIAYNWNPIKFLNNTVTMNTTYSVYGVYYLSNQSSNTVISHDFIGNTISNFSSYGIFASSTHGTTNAPFKCYNNIVNNGTNAYTTGYYGIYSYSTGVTEFLHNTVRMNFAGTSTTYSGMYYGGTTATTTIKNNIFSVAAGSLTPLYLATSPTGNNVNYNVYHNGSSTTGSLVYRNGTFFNPSNYKTAAAGGDTSFNEVPSFLSVTNLHLKDGCGPKGFDLTSIVGDDIDKQTRAVPPQVGADEASSLNNDMSVTALLTPVAPITLGSQDLVFRVKNVGANTVTSFDASYTLNSGTPVSQFWSGTLAACDTVSVTFTGSQQITLGTFNAVKVYTANPNFSLDPSRLTDTISATYLAPLNGAYTINPSAAVSATNFQTFAAVASALTAGIAGPVSFTVSAGTYPQVAISGIFVGASATNNIVFDGVNPSNRIISTSTASQSALLLNNTSYVTFKNFTIQNTIAGGATGVGIVNGGNNTIQGCTILLPNVSTNTAYGIAVTSTANGYGTGATAADSIVLDSNRITGGGTNGIYYGIMIYGNQNASQNRGIVVTKNTVTLSYYMGFYIPYIYNQARFEYNNITMNPTNGYYGMYNYYHQNLSTTQSTTYIGNVVRNFGGYGIYMAFNGSGGTSTAPLKVYNNIVDNGVSTYGGFYGIYLSNTGFTEFYNNVTRMTYAGTSNTYSGLYYTGSANGLFKNNYFLCESTAGITIPAYFATSPSTGFVNYNSYYNNANTTLLFRGGNLTSSTYKTTTGGGDSSYFITTSPFINATLGNFNLTNGCGGKGISTPNTIDITGYTRNSPPDVGPYEFQGGLNNEISIDALLSPVFPISAGTNVVAARIRNTGANAVTSFDLAYTINGGTPVTTSWFGTLNACDTVSLSFSTPFTVVGGTIYNLKVYSSNPNFSLDANRANDTVSSQVVTPMNGTYTIGAIASDFTTFNAAVAGLTSRGVDGPVLFNVKSGVYTESVNLIQAPGMSAINTVTFTSMANNKDSVRLAWNSATGNNYVLGFTGNFFKVNAITINSTSTGTTTYGVNVGTNASYDTLSNCNVRMPMYYTTSVLTYSIYANSVSGIGMGYVNNLITGSYYGVYYYGNSANRPKYTYWKGNTFDSSSYAPFYYNYYGNYSTYDGNTFRSRPTVSSTTNYMYWYYQDSAYTFTNNVCDFGTGISVYWYNYYKANTPTARGLVANNAINALGLCYLYFGNSVTSNLDFYNNSFNMGTGYFYLANTGLTNINIRNNIFSGSGANPFYITTAPSASIINSNYNNFFSTGSASPIYAGAAYNLNSFRTTYPLFDRNSVSYRAAFTSTTNLTPNANDSAIWILNGRGDYLSRVTTDINGNPRPATIADGAPDLGAYNVNPGVNTLAPRAIATPATPTAGSTQLFTFGLDTVASITWDAFTTPPASVQVRQYSGKAPLLIGTVTNFPYFYTSISAPAGTYLYDAKINYRDNWMGTMYSTFGFTEDNMRLANKDVFTAWNTNSGSTIDTLNNNLIQVGFTDANMLFTGSDIFNPLPVKLTTFNGSLLNADAKLSWTTASEVNANMFVLERSIDGKNFEAITKVKAAGNSSSLKAYSHLDKGIITLLNSAGTIYYRLKMVDNDNTFSYSKTIEIRTIENTKEKVTVTPNPFTTDLTISVETVNNANGTVEISDINGRVIISQNIEVVKGTSTITVSNTDKLKQGIYFVRYTTETSTQVFKMLKN